MAVLTVGLAFLLAIPALQQTASPVYSHSSGEAQRILNASTKTAMETCNVRSQYTKTTLCGILIGVLATPRASDVSSDIRTKAKSRLRVI